MKRDYPLGRTGHENGKNDFVHEVTRDGNAQQRNIVARSNCKAISVNWLTDQNLALSWEEQADAPS
jgi:hypothetical protein